MSNSTKTESKKTHYVRRVIVVLTLVVLVSPYVLSATSYRDQILNKILDDPDLTLTSESASFGWLSNLSIDQLEIKNASEQIQISIEQLQADRSWLSLWAGSPHLGRIKLENPLITIDLTNPIRITDQEGTEGPLQPLRDYWSQ